jgi:hypothetical protein
MCMFRSPFVPALAALGATALLGACGKNGGAGVARLGAPIQIQPPHELHTS